MEAVLAHEPFRGYRDRFNFVAVALQSAESGVSVPLEGQWKDTALSSHFSTFYSDRYLTTLRLRKLHDMLCGIPYEHIIILANTDTYGGGGDHSIPILLPLRTIPHSVLWSCMSSATALPAWLTNIIMTTSSRNIISQIVSRGSRTLPPWLTFLRNGRICFPQMALLMP